MKKHALVIGGSGMLKEVSLWLASQGYNTHVIGRNTNKLEILTQESKCIFPIAVDYYDQHTLRKEIRTAIEEYCFFDIVVAWIHEHADQVFNVVTEEMQKVSSSSCETYHILGSSQTGQKMKRGYYTIQLEYMVEDGQSRWLTHKEICAGVIESIQQKKDIVVGQLEPRV